MSKNGHLWFGLAHLHGVFLVAAVPQFGDGGGMGKWWCSDDGCASQRTIPCVQLPADGVPKQTDDGGNAQCLARTALGRWLVGLYIESCSIVPSASR